MVCAFIPLFTMPARRADVGPMADTYAFALGGALLLALTLTPVLCLLFFRNFKPVRDNFLVRFLKIALPLAAEALPEIPLGDDLASCCC